MAGTRNLMLYRLKVEGLSRFRPLAIRGVLCNVLWN